MRTALALATAAECEEVAAQIRNDLAESKKKDKAAITVLKQELRTKRAAAAEEAKKRRKAAAKAKAEARAKAKAAGRRMRRGVAPEAEAEAEAELWASSQAHDRFPGRNSASPPANSLVVILIVGT